VTCILKIDFRQVFAVVHPSVTARKLATLASLARNEWIRLAKQQCGATVRNDYVRGIQPVVGVGGGYVIVLAGVFPNLVERGWHPRDLRKTLLKASSPKVRRSKEGHLYRFIYFRHKGVSKARGSDGKQASKLRATTTGPGGKMKWGGRFRDPTGPQKPHHAVGLRENMYRFSAPYSPGQRQQSHYGTFRTISTNPATMRGNWMHPGILPHSIAPQVQDYVRRMAPRVIGG